MGECEVTAGGGNKISIALKIGSTICFLPGDSTPKNKGEIIMFNNRMARNNYFAPLMGEVYNMKFSGPAETFNGWHPGIICQNFVGNKYSGCVIAIPVTSKVDRLDIPTNVILPAPDVGLYRTSMAMCSSLQVVPKSDIGNYVTTIPDAFMKQIAEASIYAMPLIAYLIENDIFRIHKKAMGLSGIMPVPA